MMISRSAPVHAVAVGSLAELDLDAVDGAARFWSNLL
jgi:hypothetical protein